MTVDLEKLLSSYGDDGSAEEYAQIAEQLEIAGDFRHAATAYDRAYGVDPLNEKIVRLRARLLGQLAVTEHGLTFRYIPAGTFLMGSMDGDPDEQPVHPVRLTDYWLSETPVSWAAYCDLMGWLPPPEGYPSDYLERMRQRREHPPVADEREKERQDVSYMVGAENKIRLQYCENDTLTARDWHAHAQPQTWTSNGKPVPSSSIFGLPARSQPERPWGYDQKPLISVSWRAAQVLGEHMSDQSVQFRLPTEAEWEKGARGGLLGAQFAWGNEPPTADLADFNRMTEFSIKPVKNLPPNSYGLYGMSGGVWEWVEDWYDSDFYAASPVLNPRGPETGEEKVLRGGSWSDCGDSIRVSFRTSRLHHSSPNIGFRLCRIAASR